MAYISAFCVPRNCLTASCEGFRYRNSSTSVKNTEIHLRPEVKYDSGRAQCHEPRAAPQHFVRNSQ